MARPQRTIAAVTLIVAGSLIAAAAAAGYSAPAPDRGFRYIFDGTADGSDASFDRWVFSGPGGAGGRQTLDPGSGAIDPNDSPFGSIWYPTRAFGNVSLRLQFMVEDGPDVTANGGVMIRVPEVRYTGANEAAVLAQKPGGYSYRLCPGAIPPCGRARPVASTAYRWAGSSGPGPPASGAGHDDFLYRGPYCAREGTHNVANLAGTGPLTTNANADDHEHWAQIYCGHEIQINESLTGGGPHPSGDPVKTGSIYGFRNLNAKQSRTFERLEVGVWHDLEIRMVAQQYTVLVDGRVINQFDNSIPKIASRDGDPPTMARQLPRGYVGLQTHGGSDRIWYREVQVNRLTPAEVATSRHPPRVLGRGRIGARLRCTPGSWSHPASLRFNWYRANPVPRSHPHFRAPSQLDLGSFETPAEPAYGTDDLTWLDSLRVGNGRRYRLTADDAGKVVYCQVSATRAGTATTFATRRAPRIPVAALRRETCAGRTETSPDPPGAMTVA